MESRLLGLTSQDVKRLAYDFAVKLKIPHPFSLEDGNNFILLYNKILSSYNTTENYIKFEIFQLLFERKQVRIGLKIS